MKIVVFAGPSRIPFCGKDDHDLIWLPPAGQCHVLSAVHRLNPDVVVIADTETSPGMSVMHKELLWVLSRGIRLLGTAGGGAIRAAELSFCGMKGHGRVYDRIVQGALEDDAQVCCRWEKTPDGFKRITEPLVNIMATLETEEIEAGTTPPERALFLTAARSIFYEERTRSAMAEALRTAGLSKERADSILDDFDRCYLDIQAADLRATLESLTLPGFLPDPLGPDNLPVPMNDQGAIFRTLYDRDRIVEAGDVSLRLRDIGNYVTVHHPQGEALAYNAFNRELALLLAEEKGVDPDEAEIRETTDRFRRISGLAEEPAFQRWLLENDLSMDDFTVLMRDETRIRILQEGFLSEQIFQKNTRPMLDYLRLAHEYPEYRKKAFDREQVVEKRTDQLKEAFRSMPLPDLIKERHRVQPLPWKEKIQPAADALGIGLRELKIELLKDRIREQALLEQIERALF